MEKQSNTNQDISDTARHVPEPMASMKNMIIHRANERGHADHGWLKANFSFSFANWHDASRMHFGVLRVMNDDLIAAGKGFGSHPHDNMEIITIPLKGSLQHKDDMGNSSIIRAGDIQVMSAGTGIVHSEFNPDPLNEANTLQIWLFPNERQVTPRYQQMSIDPALGEDRFQQILSPHPDDAGVWIHQDAWFHWGRFRSGSHTKYQVAREGNGAYVFLINGTASINGQELGTRDAIGIWNEHVLDIQAGSDGAEILLQDVPMSIGS